MDLREVVYLWADDGYAKTGVETEKAAHLVVTDVRWA